MHTRPNDARLGAGRRRIRIGAYIVLSIALVGLIGLAALRAYVIVLRNRAEVLNEHVLALKPGVSTLHDVREFVRRYGRPDNYIDKCDESECHVSTGILAFPFLHPAFDTRVLRVFGIRPAHYGAAIDVINGQVNEVAFSVFYRTNSGWWMMGGSSVLDSFRAIDRCSNPGLSRHSEYAVSSGVIKQLSHAPFIRAGVTSKATAEEFNRAKTLNLACVTSLRECTLSNLMPLAYDDWLADKKWEKDNQERLAREQSQCKSETSSSNASAKVPW